MVIRPQTTVLFTWTMWGGIIVHRGWWINFYLLKDMSFLSPTPTLSLHHVPCILLWCISGWHMNISHLHRGQQHENQFFSPTSLISPLCVASDRTRPPMPWPLECRSHSNRGGGFARLFQLHLLFSAAKENILFTDSCYCDNTSSVVCTAMCDVADHGKAASYCHNS